MRSSASATAAGWCHLVTYDARAAACPACGVFPSSVRQRRTTGRRDLGYESIGLSARWHKVQYSCRGSACARRALSEQIAQVPAGAQVTGRLRQHVAERVGEGLAGSVAAGELYVVAHRSRGLGYPQPKRCCSSRDRSRCWGSMRPAAGGRCGGWARTAGSG